MSDLAEAMELAAKPAASNVYSIPRPLGQFRIGIDPGVSGALAFIAPDDSLSDVIDMPTMTLTGKRQTVNGAELGKIVRGWLLGSDSVIGVLEQVSAMPGQGVSSMFSFGTSYGIVQGVMAALNVPLMFVTPQAWKKRAGIPPKSEKDFARSVAQRLYPCASLERKKDIGRADAILIGRFGMVKP